MFKFLKALASFIYLAPITIVLECRVKMSWNSFPCGANSVEGKSGFPTSVFSSLFPLGCLVVAISSAPASAASVRDVYASCVCRRRERRSLLSECAALSPRPLPFRPSPPSPFLGSWCLTQTCAFDTHTQTDDTGEGRSVMCDEWPPGRRDGISGARPLSSPPPPKAHSSESPALAPGIPTEGSPQKP